MSLITTDSTQYHFNPCQTFTAILATSEPVAIATSLVIINKIDTILFQHDSHNCQYDEAL